MHNSLIFADSFWRETEANVKIFIALIRYDLQKKKFLKT